MGDSFEIPKSKQERNENQTEYIEKSERISGSNFILDLSQQESAPYNVEVLGRDFIVLPNVFSPKYFAETAFFTKHITGMLKVGDRYLDMGCGAGVTTVFAALKGINVTALDINPTAIENTKQNVNLFGVKEEVRILESDVYSALAPDEQFDVIYWNHPFGYRAPGTELTVLQRSVFDVGYESSRRFIMEAPLHLSDGGVLYLGTSTTIGQVPLINEIAHESSIRFEQVDEMIDPDSPPDVKITLQLLKGVCI